MRQSKSWRSVVKASSGKPRWAAFADRLKESRKAADLTARAAAERLKVPYARYSKWELGTRMPADITEIERIATTFGVSPAWLAFGAVNDKELAVEARLARIEHDISEIKATVVRIFR